MSSITVWFIRCAIIYLLMAVLIGIHMSTAGPVMPYLSIHAHFNLLGFMAMMIYGVGYHILPRFSGKPLWSEGLSYWHLVLANAGLLGMAAGWIVKTATGSPLVLTISAVVESVSIVFFAVNMLKTIKAAPPVKPAAAK